MWDLQSTEESQMVILNLLFPSHSRRSIYTYASVNVCARISVHEGIRVCSTELDVALDRRTNTCDHYSRGRTAEMEKTSTTTGTLLYFNCSCNHFKDPQHGLLHFYPAPPDCSTLTDDSSCFNTSERSSLENLYNPVDIRQNSDQSVRETRWDVSSRLCSVSIAAFNDVRYHLELRDVC